MTVLTIDNAKYPDGCSATLASGGGLATSTTYYYRVAAVTSVGETCSSASFSGATESSHKTLNLAWNKVAGVKATWGYRIYRNTSDSWISGSLLLATVDTNSYVDDGSAVLDAGVPVAFNSSVQNEPENIRSILPVLEIPGKEGGATQYLGSYPKTLKLQVVLHSSSAKPSLDKLTAIRASGIACQYTITAFSETWIQANYLISQLTYGLETGTPQQSGGEVLRITIDLTAS